MSDATNLFLKRIADALQKLVEIEEEKLQLYKGYREFKESEEYLEKQLETTESTTKVQ